MIDYFNYYILPSSPTRSKLSIHLVAQAQSPPDAAGTIIEKAVEALGISEKQSPISSPTDAHQNKDKKDGEHGEMVRVATEGNGTKPHVITDVREFKSMLQVSAGPRPVKHITEFEELESKL